MSGKSDSDNWQLNSVSFASVSFAEEDRIELIVAQYC